MQNVAKSAWQGVSNGEVRDAVSRAVAAKAMANSRSAMKSDRGALPPPHPPSPPSAGQGDDEIGDGRMLVTHW